MVTESTQLIKAMAVIQRPHDRAMLVSEYTGPDSEPFHRPLGGHVEFGEYAADTIRRELVEEIGQPVAGVRLLGVLENIFQWRNRDQHEVVFVFAARFTDAAAYQISEQRILDNADVYTRVIWRQPAAASPPLYPAGLSGLLPD